MVDRWEECEEADNPSRKGSAFSHTLDMSTEVFESERKSLYELLETVEGHPSFKLRQTLLHDLSHPFIVLVSLPFRCELLEDCYRDATVEMGVKLSFREGTKKRALSCRRRKRKRWDSQLELYEANEVIEGKMYLQLRL